MSFHERFGSNAPDEVRSMLKLALERSRDKGADVQFEVLADIGEFNRLHPELRIECAQREIAVTTPSIACPNVIPVGWRLP